MWTWRTAPSGLVEVNRGTGTFEAISLPGDDAGTRRTETWADLAAAAATRYRVPLPWVLAVIYAESAGKPRARNSCCGGLMQLNLSAWKITEEQAFDPAFSLDLGTKFLGKIRAAGRDLPTTASIYNHGSLAKSSKSVWGMVEDMPAVPWTGYIEKVVRASNFWTMVGVPTLAIPPLTSKIVPTPPGVTPPPTASPPATGQDGAGTVLRVGAFGGALLGAYLLTLWTLSSQRRAVGV